MGDLFMDREDKIEVSSELLMDFLKEELRRHDLPQGLWHQLEKQYGDQVYQAVLYFLTQMHFEPDEARMHWNNILAHRAQLEKIVGRDLGLRVAMTDYFINVQPKVENPILVEIHLFLQKEETALRDELTGLYNRRFFNKMFRRELERSRRFREPSSLLMLDIDHFKVFNDRFGHPEGDRALKDLADLLRRHSRAIDHLTRYGGEEFAIILPRADRDQAVIAAERHRLAVENHHFFQREGFNLTVSIGLAVFPDDAADGLQLLERADQALYQAKRSGRNRVVASFTEKRRYPRFPMESEIRFDFLKSGQDLLPGRTRNISMGGILGEIDRLVPIGRRLEMDLPSIEEDRKLHLRGRCVRIDEDLENKNLYLMGIRFDFASDEEEQVLKDLIQKHLSTELSRN